MFDSKKRTLLFAFSIVVLSVLFSVLLSPNALILARTRPQQNTVITPGYYYVDGTNTEHDGATSEIELTISSLRIYRKGLQVVFSTEASNDTVAAVTLKINDLRAKPLLARNGSPFQLRQLQSGVILTATYDGVNFISDYNTSRTLKGIHVATATIAAGTYTEGHYYTWAIPSGVAAVSAGILPASEFDEFDTDLANGRLNLPKTPMSISHIGWTIEITKGTDVVFTRPILFGYFSDFESVEETSDEAFEFGQWFFEGGYFDNVNNPTIALFMRQDVTLSDAYVYKIYATEN